MTQQTSEAIFTDDEFISTLKATAEECASLPLAKQIESLAACMTAGTISGDLGQCQMRAQAALDLIRATTDIAQRVAIAIAADQLSWPAWDGGEPGFWLEAIHVDMDLAEAGRQAGASLVEELITLGNHALEMGLTQNPLLSREQVLSFIGHSSRVNALALLHPKLNYEDKKMLLKDVSGYDLQCLFINNWAPDDIAGAVADDIQAEALSQIWALLLAVKQEVSETNELELLYEELSESILDGCDVSEFNLYSSGLDDAFNAETGLYSIQSSLVWAIANNSSVAQIARKSLWLPAVAAFSASPSAEPDELASLARHDAYQVRACVAMNLRTPAASLAELACDKVALVRQMAFENPNATDETRAQAALIGFDGDLEE